MRIKYVVLASMFILAGCSSKPDCGSDESVKLITSMVKENNLLGDLYQAALSQQLKELGSGIEKRGYEELRKLGKKRDVISNKRMSMTNQCEKIGKESPELMSAIKEKKELKDQLPRLFSASPDGYGKFREKVDPIEKRVSSSEYFISLACGGNSYNNKNIDINQVIPGLLKEVKDFSMQNILPLVQEIKTIEGDIESLKLSIAQSRKDEINKLREKTQENIKNAKLILDDIVTQSKNEQTDAVTCKAKLKVIVKDLVDTNGMIYYKLEKTSKGDLYATITDITD